MGASPFATLRNRQAKAPQFDQPETADEERQSKVKAAKKAGVFDQIKQRYNLQAQAAKTSKVMDSKGDILDIPGLGADPADAPKGPALYRKNDKGRYEPVRVDTEDATAEAAPASREDLDKTRKEAIVKKYSKGGVLSDAQQIEAGLLADTEDAVSAEEKRAEAYKKDQDTAAKAHAAQLAAEESEQAAVKSAVLKSNEDVFVDEARRAKVAATALNTKLNQAKREAAAIERAIKKSIDDGMTVAPEMLERQQKAKAQENDLSLKVAAADKLHLESSTRLQQWEDGSRGIKLENDKFKAGIGTRKLERSQGVQADGKSYLQDAGLMPRDPLPALVPAAKSGGGPVASVQPGAISTGPGMPNPVSIAKSPLMAQREEMAGQTPDAEMRRVAMADIQARKADPLTWEKAQVDTLAGQSDDYLATQVETWPALIEQGYANIQARQQQHTQAAQIRRQEIAKLEEENEAVIGRGYRGADVEIDPETGKTWNKQLIAQRNSKRALAAQKDAEAQDEMDVDTMELQRDERVQQARMIELQARSQGTVVDAEAKQKQQLMDMDATGQHGTATEMRKIKAERETRLADINKNYKEGTDEHAAAINALNNEVKGRVAKAEVQGKTIVDVAKEEYANHASGQRIDWMNTQPSDAPESQSKTSEGIYQVGRFGPTEQARAKKLGMTEKDYRYWMATMAQLDWSQNNAVGGQVVETKDQQVRRLPNGNITVNPGLILDKEGYTKAVESSGASDEAKKIAYEARNEAAPEMAAKAVKMLRANGSMSKWLDANTKGTDAERMDQFTTKMRERGWSNTALQGFMATTASIGANVLGAAGAITGNDDLIEAKLPSLLSADYWSKRADAYGFAANTASANLGVLAKYSAKAIGSTPSLLESYVVGGVLGGAAKVLGASKRVIDGVAIGAAAGDAGMQSFGGTYLEAYDAALQDGMGKLGFENTKPTAKQVQEVKDKARLKALVPALVSGGITATLTAMGGAKGAEAMLTARDSIKKGLMSRLGDIGVNIGEESFEEGFDTFWQGFLKQATYASDSTSMEQIFNEALESAIVGGVIGGGVATLKNAAEALLPEKRPETAAAVDAQIKASLKVQDGDKREADAATAIVKIHGGAKLEELTQSELAALGYRRNAKGEPEQVKGVRPSVYAKDGHLVITDQALNGLATRFPAVNNLGLITEEERLAQIAERATGAGDENATRSRQKGDAGVQLSTATSKTDATGAEGQGDDEDVSVDGANAGAVAGGPKATVATEVDGKGGAGAKVGVSQQTPLDQKAHEAATSNENDLPEPTEEQKQAGNYKKGHLKVGGIDISIENPHGSERSGINRKGEKWTSKMHGHYGYIKGTTGADGDHIDVNVKPGTEENWDGTVFVVNQLNEDGSFDEHKLMVGYDTEAEAKQAYKKNYAKGWAGYGGSQHVAMKDLAAKVKSGSLRKGATAPKNYDTTSNAGTGRPGTSTSTQPSQAAAIAQGGAGTGNGGADERVSQQLNQPVPQGGSNAAVPAGNGGGAESNQNAGVSPTAGADTQGKGAGTSPSQSAGVGAGGPGSTGAEDQIGGGGVSDEQATNSSSEEEADSMVGSRGNTSPENGGVAGVGGRGDARDKGKTGVRKQTPRVWTVVTRSGKKLSIPAERASSPEEALLELAGEADMGDIINRETLVEPPPSEAELFRDREAGDKEKAAEWTKKIISKFIAFYKSLPEGKERSDAQYLARYAIAMIDPYLKGMKWDEVEIGNLSYDSPGAESMGFGIGVRIGKTDTLVIHPRILLYYATMTAQSEGRAAAEAMITHAPFHELSHSMDPNTDEEAAELWNLLDEKTQRAFVHSYFQAQRTQGRKAAYDQIKDSPAGQTYMGREFFRAQMEKLLLGKTSEEVTTNRGLARALMEMIHNLARRIHEFASHLKDKDLAGIIEQQMWDAASRLYDALPPEVQDMVKERTIMRDIGTGDVDARRAANEGKAKALPIGNPAAAHKIIEANFGPMLKALGIDLVRNFVGPSAHYVVSEGGTRRGGYIEYNPTRAATRSPGQLIETMREEIIHAIADLVLIEELGLKKGDPSLASGKHHIDFYTKVHDMMTPQEIKAVKETYTSHNNVPYIIGAEFLRMVIQKQHFGGITEQAMAGSKRADVRSKALTSIRRLLTEVGNYLKRMAGNNTPAGKQAKRVHDKVLDVLKDVAPTKRGEVQTMAAPANGLKNLRGKIIQAAQKGALSLDDLKAVMRKNGIKQIEKATDIDPSAKEISSGAEHKLWRTDNGRVIKVARTDNGGVGDYGRSGNPATYIERMEAANFIFGDDQRVEGYTSDGRIWISQPWVEGVKPSKAEMDESLTKRGWTKAWDGTYTSKDGRVVMHDAYDHNFVKRSKDGKVVPVDVDFWTDATWEDAENREPHEDDYLERSVMGLLDSLRSPSELGVQAMQPPLIGLPSKVKIAGLGEREFGPMQKARNVARAYMTKAGLPYNPPATYAKVDKERAKRIADEFEAMKHEPQNPRVAASYRAMIDETLAQWDAIRRTGLKVEPIGKDQEDPYKASPRLAQIDAMENNHLWFFPTDNGFGSGTFDPKDNPLLEFTGEVINGHKMRANDVFRIVHDYFGHFKEGVGFRADGEENAWRQHSAMYSPEARGAMTSETRGQNSWVNYGPHGEANRNASSNDTKFADQKIGLLPEWTWNEGADDGVQAMSAPSFDHLTDEQFDAIPKYEIKRARSLRRLTDTRAALQALSKGSREAGAVSNARLEAIFKEQGFRKIGSVKDIDPDAVRVPSGAEHMTWVSSGMWGDGVRAIKVTKTMADGAELGKYGISPNLVAYLERMEASNLIFGDDQRIEGYTDDGRVWISQPWVDGGRPDYDDMFDFLDRQGWYLDERAKSGTRWVSPDGRIRLIDAHPGNFVAEEGTGRIMPIDLGWDTELVSELKLAPQDPNYDIYSIGNVLEAANSMKDFGFVVPSLAGPRTDPVATLPDGTIITAAGIQAMPRPVYHGTPHKVDKFSTAKVGTGEGVQAYGWGLYFAENKKVGQDYKKKLSQSDQRPAKFNWLGMEIDANDYDDPIRHAVSHVFFNGIASARRLAKDMLRDAKAGKDYTVESGGVPYYQKVHEVAHQIKSKREIKAEGGYLYAVELLAEDEAMIDWDEKLSDQSPVAQKAIRDVLKSDGWQELLAAVDAFDAGNRNALKESGRNMFDYVGAVGSLYQTVASEMGAKNLSKQLAKAGAHGIRYLDEGSRDSHKAKKDKTSNYVIFDEGIVRILEENDKPVQAMAAPAELNLGKKGDKEALRQRNVKRIITQNVQAHPEAAPIRYVKDGDNYRLDEKGLPQAIPQEYDLLGSALAQKAAKGKRGEARRSAYVQALADALTGLYEASKGSSDITAGKEWYRVAREKLVKHFGDDTMLFAQLLAATSARTPVKENFTQALDAYNGIINGRYEGVAERYMEAMANLEAGLLTFRQSINNNKMGDVVTPKTFRDWLDVEGVLPRRENGKKFNANSMQVLNVIAGVWREKLNGPKTAQFSDNLTGASLEATIDVWAARTLHRLSNEGMEKQWRILPEAETGVNNEDFTIGQDAFRIAAQQTGMNPDDLQGMLWFAEKSHWASKGWTRARGAELSDFSSLLDYVEVEQGGKKVLRLDRDQPMLGLFYEDDQTGRPESNGRGNGNTGGGSGGANARARGVAGRVPGGRGGERVAAQEEQTLFMSAPSIADARPIAKRGLSQGAAKDFHGSNDYRAKAGAILTSFEKDWAPFFDYMNELLTVTERKRALHKVIDKFAMGDAPEAVALWEKYASLDPDQLVPEVSEQVKEAQELLPYLENLSILAMAGPKADPGKRILERMERQLPSVEELEALGWAYEQGLPDAHPENRERLLMEGIQRAQAKPETAKQWERKARAMIEDDREAVITQIMQNYFDGASFGSPELALAGSILAPELMREAIASNSQAAMRKAQAFAYANSAGQSQAGRELKALHNPHKTNAEHVRETFTNIIATPPANKRARIAAAPTPQAKEKKIAELEARLKGLEQKIKDGDKEQAEASRRTRQELEKTRQQKDREQLVEAYTSARREKVTEALKHEGVSEDDIFITPEDRLAAQDSELVEAAMAKHPEEQHEAIRYIMRGYPHAEIAKLTGRPQAEIERLHERFRGVSLKQEVAKNVKASRSIMDIIRDGFKKAMGLKMAKPKAPTPNWMPNDTAQIRAKLTAQAQGTDPKKAADAQKKLDFLDASKEIERQLAIICPTATQANSANGLSARVVKRKDGTVVTIYVKFNPDDFRSIYRVARSLSIAESTTFDKMYEYWINNLLSGPMTNWVNLIGNTLSSAVHFFPQRFLEATANLFVNDDQSASFGEYGIIARGIMPGIREAFVNAMMAFSAEADPVGHKYLDDPMQLEFNASGDIAKIGGYRGPSVGGKKGRIIRVPGRMLRAMDAGFKTFIMRAEVGAQAYRMGKALMRSGKLQKADLEKYIKQQVNTAGSKAWSLAMATAEEITFQDSNWMTDTAKMLTRGADHLAERKFAEAEVRKQDGDLWQARDLKFRGHAMMFIAKMMTVIFPFVKTPTNILRMGIRKSPLGSLLLAGHMLHAIGSGAYRFVKGKQSFDNHSKAVLVKLLAEQVQAWAVVGMLFGAAEGDDDDKDKKLLIVGGRPFTKDGARDAAYRDFGGQYMIIIRKDNGDEIRIPFAKYEPVATLLGTTIDLIKQLKLKSKLEDLGMDGGDYGSVVKATFGDFVTQAEDKSFLKGISDLIRTIDDIKRQGDIGKGIGKSLTDFILSAIIPNLIRQPMRNLDDKVRDGKKSESWYGAFPMGSNSQPMVDLFGNEVRKDEWFPGSRLLFQAANAQTEEHPIQEHIDAWNAAHPDKKIEPEAMRRVDYYINLPGKKKQKLEDNKDKLRFEVEVGKEFAARAKVISENFDSSNLGDKFKNKITDIRSEAREAVRNRFKISPFQQLKQR